MKSSCRYIHQWVRPLAVLFIACFAVLSQLGAKEMTQGYMRLVLHEATGRFTLYSLAGEDQWIPLFSSQDPRTTFLAINVNDRIYRMGETLSFRTRVEEDGNNLSYYFESATLQVRQEFSFIRTEGYQSTSGVRITFYLKNLHSQQLTVGMRFLLDTNLGEGSGKTPFYAGKQSITEETVIAGNAGRYWISRGDQVALMGSVAALFGMSPDYLHIANWKRLNEASWKPTLSKGRNFNYPPYSIGDSAVCYYYEPKPIEPNEELNYTILLALEDNSGFERARVLTNIPVAVAAERSALSNPGMQEREVTADTRDARDRARDADLALLYSHITRLNLYLDGSVEITEEELAAMELTINMLKARYGLP